MLRGGYHGVQYFIHPPRFYVELLTIQTVRLKTTIPLPKVLAWTADATNPVGAEYILMEHAAGVQLHGRWDGKSSYDHIQVVKNASMITKQMAALDFPAYGSVVFADTPIDVSRKKAFDDGFRTGPHCGTLFWNSAPGESLLCRGSSADCGPCKPSIP